MRPTCPIRIECCKSQVLGANRGKIETAHDFPEDVFTCNLYHVLDGDHLIISCDQHALTFEMLTAALGDMPLGLGTSIAPFFR